MSGYLTTHVLDTARGMPAIGLSIDLYKLEADVRKHLNQMRTNADGRTDQPILNRDVFEIGNYELIFHAGQYLTQENQRLKESLFLDIIPIRFSMHRNNHYHVPLLLSPFGYSTYRGS
ncbi:MAG: hydroxyisourate hydrolase [Rhodobacteraceae bacterium]|mgnify:CR=1 FL=1|nr:hydroxyisourate hydrolase [Paracoccaceae bacterium]